jgi:hypothetical protein
MTLAGSSSADILTLASGGSIDDGGAATLTSGNSLFAAQAGTSITLDNAGNTFNGAVAFLGLSGNLLNVAVSDTTAFDVQALNLDGNLTVNAAGPITDSGELNIAGSASFTATGAGASGNIALDAPGHDFGTLTVNTANGSVTLGAANVNNTLSVTAGGPITGSGELNVVGLASFTTTGAGALGNITVNNAANDFGSVALSSANGAAVTLTEASATVLDNVAVNGTLTITSGGNISQAGGQTVTAGGMATFNVSAANNVILDNLANNFAAVTVPQANNITLSDVNGFNLDDINAAGTLSLNTAVGAGNIVQLLNGSAIAAQTLTANLGGGLILGNQATSGTQPANQIATLGNITHSGDLYLFDSDSTAYALPSDNPSPFPDADDRLGLTINGVITGNNSVGKTVIRTTGDLILNGAAGSTVVSRPGGDIELSAENNGNFHNMLGADGSNALDPGTGRFLVFSTDGDLNFGSAIVDNKFTFNGLAADFLADYPAQSFNNTPPIIKQNGDVAGANEDGFVFLVKQDFVQATDETSKFFLDVLNLVVFSGVNATASVDNLPPDRPPTVWTSSYHIYLQEQEEAEKKKKDQQVAQLAAPVEAALALP